MIFFDKVRAYIKENPGTPWNEACKLVSVNGKIASNGKSEFQAACGRCGHTTDETGNSFTCVACGHIN